MPIKEAVSNVTLVGSGAFATFVLVSRVSDDVPNPKITEANIDALAITASVRLKVSLPDIKGEKPAFVIEPLAFG
jgi:hypothetical protein